MIDLVAAKGEDLTFERVLFFGCKRRQEKISNLYCIEESEKNLIEIASLNIAVPEGFIVNVPYNSPSFEESLKFGISELEKATCCRFGSINSPLIIALRAKSLSSVSGTLDSVLNIGINDKTVVGLAEATQNGRFAYDCYRQFIETFATFIKKIDARPFLKAWNQIMEQEGAVFEFDVSEEGVKEACDIFKGLYEKELKQKFPQDAWQQLKDAIHSIFESQTTKRALFYNEMQGMSLEDKIPITIQRMIFGNRNQYSGTGVFYTKNPINKESEVIGEYFPSTQGSVFHKSLAEPTPLTEKQKNKWGYLQLSFEERFPTIYKEILDIANKLNSHFSSAQCVEFAVEKENLYILHTRRITAKINLKTDFLNKEYKIVKKLKSKTLLSLQVNEHVARISKEDNDTLTFDGLFASPGKAYGFIVFSREAGYQYLKEGKPVILVVEKPAEDLLYCLPIAEGIVSLTGGISCKGAAFARALGKPAIFGLRRLIFSIDNQFLLYQGKTISEGMFASLDGCSGKFCLFTKCR